MLLAFIIALLAVAVAEFYDATMTEKGIKKGVSVEAFDWLVGSKPTALALYLRDWILIAVATIPLDIALVAHSKPFFYGFLTIPVSLVTRHINGGLQWRTLLNGGKLNPAPQKWSQKLFT